MKIYIISAGPYVKIGMTRGNAESRLKALQVGNPHKMRLSGVFDVSALGKDLNLIERSIHSSLDEYRCEGEWFQCDASLARSAALDVIESMIKGNRSSALTRTTPTRIACLSLRLDLFERFSKMDQTILDNFTTAAFALKWKVDMGEKFVVDYWDLTPEAQSKLGEPKKFTKIAQ